MPVRVTASRTVINGIAVIQSRKTAPHMRFSYLRLIKIIAIHIHGKAPFIYSQTRSELIGSTYCGQLLFSIDEMSAGA
jgi:hypothetical protein